MRIFGYILIILGFAGANIPVYPSGGTMEAICLHEFEKLPRQDSYKSDEVLSVMEKAAARAWYKGSLRPPDGPSLFMVIGAVLVDVGGRRKKVFGSNAGR